MLRLKIWISARRTQNIQTLVCNAVLDQKTSPVNPLLFLLIILPPKKSASSVHLTHFFSLTSIPILNYSFSQVIFKRLEVALTRVTEKCLTDLRFVPITSIKNWMFDFKLIQEARKRKTALGKSETKDCLFFPDDYLKQMQPVRRAPTR